MYVLYGIPYRHTRGIKDVGELTFGGGGGVRVGGWELGESVCMWERGRRAQEDVTFTTFQ